MSKICLYQNFSHSRFFHQFDDWIAFYFEFHERLAKMHFDQLNLSLEMTYRFLTGFAINKIRNLTFMKIYKCNIEVVVCATERGNACGNFNDGRLIKHSYKQ